MGVSKAAAELLVDLSREARFSGSALVLGRQDCVFSPAELAAWGARHGATLREPRSARADHSRRYGTTERPGMSDDAFFHALGFDETHALDRSDFEGADVIWDLNEPLPAEHHGKFDLVYNGGTLEHVFHLPNALASVCAALRPGGRAVHVAPVSNAVDHGFYQFSPTLFYDYYVQNGWELERALLFLARDFESPWTVYRYDEGSLDALSSRFFEVRVSGVTMAGLFFVAKKVGGASSTVTPQQGAYVRAWGDGGEASAKADEPEGALRVIRDAKRRLDRATPLFNPKKMPRKLGVFGR